MIHNMKEETRFSDLSTSATFHGMKRCAKCGEEKPWSEFNIDQGKKDGRQSYCRLCQEDDRLMRFYKLTREQRDLMYQQQQGECASCHVFHPQLYIYAVEGIGVISLVCPRCMRTLNGFNRNPVIVESVIDYINYFGSRVLYGVKLRFQDSWEAIETGNQKRKTRCRHYQRDVNPETYDYWSLLNNHTCYICWERCSTGQHLAKDHRHVTNRNRGLLCFLCNTTLGVAKDDTNLLRACATFLESYLVPYLAGFVSITDEMIEDADQAVHWESKAYSTALPRAHTQKAQVG